MPRPPIRQIFGLTPGGGSFFGMIFKLTISTTADKFAQNNIVVGCLYYKASRMPTMSVDTCRPTQYVFTAFFVFFRSDNSRFKHSFRSIQLFFK